MKKQVFLVRRSNFRDEYLRQPNKNNYYFSFGDLGSAWALPTMGNAQTVINFFHLINNEPDKLEIAEAHVEVVEKIVLGQPK